MEQKDKQILLSMARNAIKKQLGLTFEKIIPTSMELKKKNGCFVTLKENSNLRGCIGFMTGFMPLYETIPMLAIEAAFKDPRFDCLKIEEMESITIEISILSPLKKIESLKEFTLGKDGIIISQGFHKAVFLPQVANETGWNKKEFLEALCRKANLDINAYKSPLSHFEIFTAEVFGE
ncbi:MAG: AmmeMemoRadiSam system protein A [Sphaerochaetaceae bacterium]|nr:AmmeMemoRadiSam system protein A [Sphaerochaetaceae bacterium]